jgi:steroid delta-isomerase-like uncharacterized protein
MLRAIFGLKRPVRAEFLQAIYNLTDGNPFYIEEVLKSLIAAGDIFYARGYWDRKPIDELHIPATVLAAVQQRTATLSEGSQKLLTLVAVAGRRFDYRLLQLLTGYNEAELLAQIKALMAAQLVVEETADRFAFRHALTRQAFQMFHTAFPDLQVTIQDILADGDKVVAREQWTGTHQGEFMGMPATGKQVAFNVIDIVRFAEGKLVEHWAVSDTLALLTQLGAIPEPDSVGI